jgi:hypothetical protein
MLVSSTDRHDAASEKAQVRIAEVWYSIDVLPKQTVDAFLRHYFASVFGERLPSVSIAREYRKRFFDDVEEPVPAVDRHGTSNSG